MTQNEDASVKFQICNRRTSLNEGGFSYKPDSDKGGFTYCGISEVMHPGWVGWPVVHAAYNKGLLHQGEFIIDNNLDKMIDDFYRNEFFNRNRLGEIDDQDIINEVYDTGVNMGQQVAAKFLQHSLNILNRNQRDYPDITVDGLIGDMTLHQVNRITNKKALLKTLNGLQFMHYYEIAFNDKTQEANFIGWLNRVDF